MTDQEVAAYFSHHNENMKLLKIGFDEVRKQIKAIYHIKDSSGDYIFLRADIDPEKAQIRKIEKSLSRIISGIQVSWAEESLKRLLYEKNLLSDAQRLYLLERPALDQKWYAALKIIFSIAYDLVPATDEACESVKIHKQRRNLGDELVDQYLQLRDIITDHLVPNFSIRNKVQHGEWEFAFRPPYSQEYSPDITMKINKENMITTTSRFTLVNALYQMLVDLGRFKSNQFALDSMKTPFEYFYKSYIRKIDFEVKKIDNPNLEMYIQDILQKQIRGEQHRRDADYFKR